MWGLFFVGDDGLDVVDEEFRGFEGKFDILGEGC